MIVIYGMRAENLPGAEALSAWIGSAWELAWREQHPNLCREEPMRRSLGALSLLRAFGRGGVLSYESGGRPCLDGSPSGFSLTHTESGCFCAVTESNACVGVDAEDLCGRASEKLWQIVDRWFAEGERCLFSELPGEERFLEIWTRKEAFSKHLGVGIAASYREDTVRLSMEERLYFQTMKSGGTVISVCSPEPLGVGGVRLQMLPVLPEGQVG